MNAILQNADPLTLIAAIEENQRAFWASYGQPPTGEFYDTPSVTRFHTAIPFPFFNGVLRARFGHAEVDAAIDATAALFTARQLPFTWYTGPDTQPVDLGEHLEQHGFIHAEDLTGMAVDLRSLLEADALPPGLEIFQVKDQATLSLWTAAFNCAYEIPGGIDVANLNFQLCLGFGEHLPWRHYVGLLHGEPVATSHLFLAAGVAGIGLVGTSRHARGRGIGAAITQAPLQAARALGYQYAVLEATQMGINVYRKLGFQAYYTTGLYLWMDSSTPNWAIFDN
jgi:GNAT superfamily N-acetyltransferase